MSNKLNYAETGRGAGSLSGLSVVGCALSVAANVLVCLGLSYMMYERRIQRGNGENYGDFALLLAKPVALVIALISTSICLGIIGASRRRHWIYVALGFASVGTLVAVALTNWVL
jgi:peptidoglycan biosynthesis protein MviN/MurJ (putative lipid II flippase)